MKLFQNKTVEIQEFPGKQTHLIHVNRLKPLCESMVLKDVPTVAFDGVPEPPQPTSPSNAPAPETGRATSVPVPTTTESNANTTPSPDLMCFNSPAASPDLL